MKKKYEREPEPPAAGERKQNHEKREWRLAVTASKGMKRKVAGSDNRSGLERAASPNRGGPEALPDPAGFANQMELGNASKAEDGSRPACRRISRAAGSAADCRSAPGKETELMRVFIAHGADIDYRNHIGETALLCWPPGGERWRRGPVAARTGCPHQRRRKAVVGPPLRGLAGHGDIARLLMERGADINARSTNGSSVLMMAGTRAGGHGPAADRERGRPLGQERLGMAPWMGHAQQQPQDRPPGDQPRRIQRRRRPAQRLPGRTAAFAASPSWRKLLRMRETLSQRKFSTQTIDNRIAAERARIVRARTQSKPAAAGGDPEISAGRDPGQQSANIVYDDAGKPQGCRCRWIPSPASRNAAAGARKHALRRFHPRLRAAS